MPEERLSSVSESNRNHQSNDLMSEVRLLQLEVCEPIARFPISTSNERLNKLLNDLGIRTVDDLIEYNRVLSELSTKLEINEIALNTYHLDVLKGMLAIYQPPFN